MAKNSEKFGYTRPEGSAIWEYASAMSCAAQIFVVGCAGGWTSPALVRLLGPDAEAIPSTGSELSLMVTVCAVGLVLAPMFTIMTNKFGRKNSLLAISVAMMINWGLIGAARDVSVIYVARFIAGFCCSLGMCVAPIYLGEIASPRFRGALGTAMSTTSTGGALFAYLLVPYVTINTSGLVFLGMSTLCMTSLCFIPESPYFLAVNGKLEEAENALEKLRGKTDVTDELDLVKRTVGREDERDTEDPGPRKLGGLRLLIGVRGNRRALCILLLFPFVLNFGSFAATACFSHVIFDAMKAGISANVCATILATIQFAFSILAASVVDRFGRRPLIRISGAVSSVCLLVVAVYFYLLEHTDVDVTSYSLFPVGAMFLNTAALSSGLMPLHVVLQSEIIATDVKAITIFTAGISGGIFATLTAGLYLRVTMTWGFGHSAPFAAYFFITVIVTTLILKILPETRGKTFLEIQKDLNA